jgi:hypothetical protein
VPFGPGLLSSAIAELVRMSIAKDAAKSRNMADLLIVRRYVT